MATAKSPILHAAEFVVNAAARTVLALEAAAETCLLAPVEAALGMPGAVRARSVRGMRRRPGGGRGSPARGSPDPETQPLP